ncbi:MAG: carbonic anhydrase [Bacteroidetes bacterium]|nr:carbonic anhydrase [Bacteroidota bacterium]
MADHSRMLVITGLISLSIVSYSCKEEAGVSEKISQEQPADAREALQRLLEGNERFVSGRVAHMHGSAEWRSQLVPEQHPFATILGCSDSRVPPELLFDQGFGDLFVIRVAGNVIGRDEIGSIEYAVDHLQTQLVVVLGHEGCGAVTAALAAEEERGKELKGIQKLLRGIDPALKDIDPALGKEERLRRAVEENVRWSVEQIARLPEVEGVSEEKVAEILVAGAVYELATGRVRLIQ